MSDIFREVEEDIRREQFRQLWDKYGLYVLAIALAIILVAAGNVGWRAYTKSKNDDMSARYEAISKAAETQAPSDAAAAYGALAKEGHGGYAALAQMRQAALLHDAGDDAGAVATYDALAASSKAPPIMRDLAKLKAGLLLVDRVSYDDIKARLEPLIAEKAAWRNPAREVLAISAYKAQAYADAQKQYAAIIDDKEASAGLRTRAHDMQALLAPMLPKQAANDNTNTSAPAQKPSSAKPE